MRNSLEVLFISSLVVVVDVVVDAVDGAGAGFMSTILDLPPFPSSSPAFLYFISSYSGANLV